MFLHPSVHLQLAASATTLLAAAERRREGVRWPQAGATGDEPAETKRLETGCIVAAELLEGGNGDAMEVSPVPTAADHFGHRETDDIIVDLFWSRRLGDEFRVEVEDRCERVRFLLSPTTGKDAIDAFCHPFAFARCAARAEAKAV